MSLSSTIFGTQNIWYPPFLAVSMDFGIHRIWHILFGIHRFWHAQRNWVYTEIGYTLLLAVSMDFGIHRIWHTILGIHRFWQSRWNWVYTEIGYTPLLTLSMSFGIHRIWHSNWVSTVFGSIDGIWYTSFLANNNYLVGYYAPKLILKSQLYYT